MDLAEIHKEIGNVAFKKKDYSHALDNYNKAVKLNPNNIIYRNNIAAVHLKLGAFTDCLSVCGEAYQVGLLNNADNHSMAKCLYRMSYCHLKLNNTTTSEHFSFVAHHNHPDPTLHSLFLKSKEEFELLQKASEYYKNGEYPAAIQCYSRVIQSDDVNVEALSGRACCYAKVLEFSLSVSDCDKGLSVDPNNVDMLIRKAQSLFALCRYEEAEYAYAQVWKIDRKNASALNGLKRCSGQKNLSREETIRWLLKDPSLKTILNDPQVQALLQPHQNAFLLKKEEGRTNYHDIDKLVECGLVKLQSIT